MRSPEVDTVRQSPLAELVKCTEAITKHDESYQIPIDSLLKQLNLHTDIPDNKLLFDRLIPEPPTKFSLTGTKQLTKTTIELNNLADFHKDLSELTNIPTDEFQPQDMSNLQGIGTICERQLFREAYICPLALSISKTLHTLNPDLLNDDIRKMIDGLDSGQLKIFNGRLSRELPKEEFSKVFDKEALYKKLTSLKNESSSLESLILTNREVSLLGALFTVGGHTLALMNLSSDPKAALISFGFGTAAGAYSIISELRTGKLLDDLQTNKEEELFITLLLEKLKNQDR